MAQDRPFLVFLLPDWPHFNLLNLEVLILLFVLVWDLALSVLALSILALSILVLSILVLSILVLVCSESLWLRATKKSFSEIIVVFLVTGYFRKDAAQSGKSLVVSFWSFELYGEKNQNYAT